MTGIGSFYDGGNNYYNGWVTSSADAEYTGAITGADQGCWNLQVNYPGHLSASTAYYPTGVFPVMERFRSESTGTAEIRGDFSAFEEWQMAVDSFSRQGAYSYNTVGGGSPPIAYHGAGYVQSAGTNTLTIQSWAFGGFIMPIGGQWHNGLGVHFWLYCRGKQYMHSDSEEDVSLYSAITAGDDPTINSSWQGQLNSYWIDGAGVNHLIRIHQIS